MIVIINVLFAPKMVTSLVKNVKNEKFKIVWTISEGFSSPKGRYGSFARRHSIKETWRQSKRISKHSTHGVDYLIKRNNHLGQLSDDSNLERSG